MNGRFSSGAAVGAIVVLVAGMGIVGGIAPHGLSSFGPVLSASALERNPVASPPDSTGSTPVLRASASPDGERPRRT